ncbi:MAG: HDIG domain-containing protein [Anaerolineae bacterium]|nr:HDIG domain-containing protein [Anaerolineae bacterium]
MRAHRAQHRVRQFVRVAGAALAPVDEAYVTGKLAHAVDPPALLRLFRTMPRAERHHGVAVSRILERQGHMDRDLHVAALLHDVGKTAAPPHLWERVMVVIVGHLAPRRAEAWGQMPDCDQPVPRGLHRAFVVRRHHARWGARMTAEVGASPRAVALIRHHHDALPIGLLGAEDAGGDLDLDLLAALQAADEA